MICLKHSVLQLSPWLLGALSVCNPISFDLSSAVVSCPGTCTHIFVRLEPWVIMTKQSNTSEYVPLRESNMGLYTTAWYCFIVVSLLFSRNVSYLCKELTFPYHRGYSCFIEILKAWSISAHDRQQLALALLKQTFLHPFKEWFSLIFPSFEYSNWGRTYSLTLFCPRKHVLELSYRL